MTFILLNGAISTSASVRNIGAFFVQVLMLKDHVNRLVRSCFYQLYQNFIISWVDYCIGLLYGASANLTYRFQLVLNLASMALDASITWVISCRTGFTGYMPRSRLSSSVPFLPSRQNMVWLHTTSPNLVYNHWRVSTVMQDSRSEDENQVGERTCQNNY